MHRHGHRQPDVLAAGDRVVDEDPFLRSAVAVRGCRHDRAVAGDKRLRAHRAGGSGAVRRRGVDRGVYWFTSSTSFANPAVTIARMLSDTFAGIKPSSAPMFILMQLIGAGLAFGLIRFLTRTLPRGPPMTDIPTARTAGSAVRVHPQRRALANGCGPARSSCRRPCRCSLRRYGAGRDHQSGCGRGNGRARHRLARQRPIPRGSTMPPSRPPMW